MHLSNSGATLLHWTSEAKNSEAFDYEATNADPLALSTSRILLAATVIGAPWAFGAVDSWAWMSLGLAACLVLLLWAIGSVQQGVLKFVWSPLYIPLVLFLLLGFIQYGAHLTLDRLETRTALALFAVNLTFFFASVQLFGGTKGEARRQFGLAILVFAGVLGLFSILQFASGTQKIYWTFDTYGNFFGPYSNPDHYAGLLEMLIPVAAFAIAERRKSIANLALPVLAITIAVASLLLSGSRSGLLALSAEVVIAVTLGRWHARLAQGRERRALAPVGATVALSVLAAVLLFCWVDTGYVVKRLGSVGSPGEAWAEWSSFRKSVAVDSLRILHEHHVFGVGLGNFEIAYPKYQTFPTDLAVDYAHDDYVEAIAETGVVGGALILLALTLFFRLSFRNLGERLQSGRSWIQLGAAVGCCGLLVHSFLDFNLHIPANAAWFAVLAGIATSEVEPRRRAPSSLDHRASS